MKIIKGMIIFIFIAVIILGVFLFASKNNNNNENINVSSQVNDYTKEEKNISKIKNYNEFYSVSNCVQKFITYSSLELNSPLAKSMNINDETQKKEVIYGFLDKSFIAEKNITIDNLYERIGMINASSLAFTAININTIAGSRGKEYAVYGRLDIENSYSFQYAYFKVKVDDYNRAFCIVPYYSGVDNINDILLDEYNQGEITKNKYNEYKLTSISDFEIVLKIFGNFKNEAIKNIENAYGMLNADYREKRFGDINLFKNYIENQISKSQVKEYSIEENNGIKEYICIDQYNNYYIFYENNIMDYTVILDTYTIDIPEFTEKYTTAKEQEKVALNIQKIFQALNSKDYRYVYSKLADSFKNNYFKTQQDFENYIKNKVFEYNDVEYVQYNKSGNLNQYKLKLTDKTESNFDENGIEKTSKRYVDFSIVMQLGEGTEFTMSFEI